MKTSDYEYWMIRSENGYLGTTLHGTPCWTARCDATRYTDPGEAHRIAWVLRTVHETDACVVHVRVC